MNIYKHTATQVPALFKASVLEPKGARTHSKNRDTLPPNQIWTHEIFGDYVSDRVKWRVVELIGRNIHFFSQVDTHRDLLKKYSVQFPDLTQKLAEIETFYAWDRASYYHLSRLVVAYIYCAEINSFESWNYIARHTVFKALISESSILYSEFSDYIKSAAREAHKINRPYKDSVNANKESQCTYIEDESELIFPEFWPANLPTLFERIADKPVEVSELTFRRDIIEPFIAEIYKDTPAGKQAYKGTTWKSMYFTAHEYLDALKSMFTGEPATMLQQVRDNIDDPKDLKEKLAEWVYVYSKTLFNQEIRLAMQITRLCFVQDYVWVQRLWLGSWFEKRDTPELYLMRNLFILLAWTFANTSPSQPGKLKGGHKAAYFKILDSFNHFTEKDLPEDRIGIIHQQISELSA